MSEALHCPTCRASWRGASPCPRCGTDLAPLMRVAARAWRLREAARAALEAGREPEASGLAGDAFRLHATSRGRRLLILSLLAAGRMRDAARIFARPESLDPASH